ncbi:hypothetical protein C8Q74DRAFT_1283220 [Fomes fomentarius]|nr:hypothetical protein C8Q74DRAFT_1283220 [Fomes fomentarius]
MRERLRCTVVVLRGLSISSPATEVACGVIRQQRAGRNGSSPHRGCTGPRPCGWGRTRRRSESRVSKCSSRCLNCIHDYTQLPATYGIPRDLDEGPFCLQLGQGSYRLHSFDKILHQPGIVNDHLHHALAS